MMSRQRPPTSQPGLSSVLPAREHTGVYERILYISNSSQTQTLQPQISLEPPSQDRQSVRLPHSPESNASHLYESTERTLIYSGNPRNSVSQPARPHPNPSLSPNRPSLTTRPHPQRQSQRQSQQQSRQPPQEHQPFPQVTGSRSSPPEHPQTAISANLSPSRTRSNNHHSEARQLQAALLESLQEANNHHALPPTNSPCTALIRAHNSPTVQRPRTSGNTDTHTTRNNGVRRPSRPTTKDMCALCNTRQSVCQHPRIAGGARMCEKCFDEIHIAEGGQIEFK